VVLKSTSTYTSTIPQSEPLPEPLPTPIYKPTTLNLKPKTIQVFDFSEFGIFIPLVQKWIDYKNSRKENYKSQASLNAFVKILTKYSENKFENAENIIEQSMANNWAGIFKPKPEFKKFENEETTLKKFNVDNPSKNSEISNKISLALKGRKIKRTNEWQKNIITAKKKNGTIKHSQETKEKITNSLNIFHQKNIDREKYITNSSNTKHLTGWYKKLHFRSSLELSFLINNQNVNFESCENKLYGIVYIIDGKSKIYYPDFTDGQFIYEIKPYSLLNYKNNNLKIKLGYEKYSNNFKLITEKESPYVSKKIIEELIKLGVIILSKSSENKFKKYKY
jgi:hypothetical protein